MVKKRAPASTPGEEQPQPPRPAAPPPVDLARVARAEVGSLSIALRDQLAIGEVYRNALARMEEENLNLRLEVARLKVRVASLENEVGREVEEAEEEEKQG